MEELVTAWQAAISANPAAPSEMATASVQGMLATLTSALSWMIAADSTPQTRPDYALFSLPSGDLLPQTARLAGNNTLFIETIKAMTDNFNAGLQNIAASLSSTSVYILDAHSLFNDIHADPSLVSTDDSVGISKATH